MNCLFEGVGCLLAALVILSSSSAVAADTAAGDRDRPNLLVIVADDLGFSDLGAFGGEIRTPNLDRLAAEGVRFTHAYSAPTCSPTRAMLLTGVDHHRAGLGSMAEMLTPGQQGAPGYEGGLNGRVVTVARRLQSAGHRTAMSGKWHLGGAPEQDPSRRGFERSFVLIDGGAGHFDASSLSPRAERATYREDGAPTSLPADFYSSDHFTDRLIEFLDVDDERPFFGYLAFTAPHWPLQAPPEDIARYANRYEGGWEALRIERLQRQKLLGLLPPAATLEQDPEAQAAWEDLDAPARAIAAREMAVYAGMVDRLDANVGRLLDLLERRGELDQTIIVFVSDNGAEGHEPRHLGLDQWVARTFDNRLGNIGRKGSYVMYGPHWARAATAPSLLHKGFPTEGGIRVPMIVRRPAGAGGGRIEDAVVTVRDLTPTLLDLARVDPEADAALAPEGRSLVPLFEHEGRVVHDEDEVLAWELFGKRAVRRGPWKAVSLPPPHGDGHWTLHHLVEDPGERVDLAQEHPRKLDRLVQAWEHWAEEQGVVLPETEIPY